MTSILDLIYKGRMTITPQSTYAIRSLVKVLMINAEDVSIIASGSKKPVTPILPASTASTASPEVQNTRKRKRESLGETPKPAKIPKSGGRKKTKKGQKGLETAASNEEPTGFHDYEDVETWVCAICQCYDPVITSPVKPGNPDIMTTEWIGCDCNRWYHKYCTKLKHIDDSFSCKQLNRECLPLT